MEGKKCKTACSKGVLNRRLCDFLFVLLALIMLTSYFDPGLLPHAQILWIDELAAGTKRVGPVNRTGFRVQ